MCNPTVSRQFSQPLQELNSTQMQIFQEVSGSAGTGEIWCGDFNAYNTLWGSHHIDTNGEVVEELIEKRARVCLKDGIGTRVFSLFEKVSFFIL